VGRQQHQNVAFSQPPPPFLKLQNASLETASQPRTHSAAETEKRGKNRSGRI